MHFLKKLVKALYYYFFEIKGNFFFKLKYFFEKIVQFIVAKLNGLYKLTIKAPYFLNKDYVIENSDGKFAIRHHTDFDYHIQPYYEAELLPYFKIENGIFLDIGSHFGRYSIRIGNQKNNVKIYCFEPNPTTYTYLQKNILLNHLSKKIQTFPFGLSSKKGTSTFVFFDENTGSSQIPNEKTDNILKSKGKFHKVTINLETGDDFIRENKIDPIEIKLIKIDVEGHEIEVLKGMQKFLEATENKCSIICEILSLEELKKINDFIEIYGFKNKKIDEYNYLFYR